MQAGGVQADEGPMKIQSQAAKGRDARTLLSLCPREPSRSLDVVGVMESHVTEYRFDEVVVSVDERDVDFLIPWHVPTACSRMPDEGLPLAR